MGTLGVFSPRIGIMRAAARAAMAAQSPIQPHKGGLRLIGGQRQIGCQRHIGGDGGQTKSLTQPRMGDFITRHLRQASLHRQAGQIHITGGGRMRPRTVPQNSNIIGQNRGSFCPQNGRAFGLRVLHPIAAVLARSRIPPIGHQKDQSICMMLHWLGLGRHAFSQIRHDHINASGQSLGLAGLQSMGQAVNLRVAPRSCQPVRLAQRRYANHGDIIKIGEGFEVTGALETVLWNFRGRLILRAIAHRIHHGLKFRHRRHQAGTACGPLKGQIRPWGKPIKIGHMRATFQNFRRKAPHMHRAIAI